MVTSSRTTRIAIGLVSLVAAAAGAGGAAPVPVRVTAVSQDGRAVVVDPSSGTLSDPGWRLAAFADRTPLGWYGLAGKSDLGEVYGRQGPPPGEAPTRVTQAWLVGADDVSDLVPIWPADAELFCRIETVGPGAMTVWLAVGVEQGVQSGESWLARVGGQPIARFDIAHVAADVCFARVLPLVSEPRLRSGQRVAQWPSPGESRTGRASTRVSYVEPGSDTPLIWIAALPDEIATPETNIDFARDGEFICHGVVERVGDRFWYVRPVPLARESEAPIREVAPAAATTPPATQPTTCPTSQPTTCPTSQPAQTPTDANGQTDPRAVRVGDTAVIRTTADIDAGRYVAHVFERVPGGYLVNAGEREGLVVGATGVARGVTSDPVVVRVARVQRAYSRVTVPTGEVLNVGDEVRFGALPDVVQPVAQVSAVADETLFTATLCDGASVHAGQVFAVCEATRTVAVAVVLGTDGKLVFGYVPRCSLTR
ncbi:MAG: hypothetical protein JXO22_10975, partial [Phycisphaerae bacterium]|nr:hypothetical protein [Phycisphaerae bacterium]